MDELDFLLNSTLKSEVPGLPYALFVEETRGILLSILTHTHVLSLAVFDVGVMRQEIHPSRGCFPDYRVSRYTKYSIRQIYREKEGGETASRCSPGCSPNQQTERDTDVADQLRFFCAAVET